QGASCRPAGAAGARRNLPALSLGPPERCLFGGDPLDLGQALPRLARRIHRHLEQAARQPAAHRPAAALLRARSPRPRHGGSRPVGELARIEGDRRTQRQHPPRGHRRPRRLSALRVAALSRRSANGAQIRRPVGVAQASLPKGCRGRMTARMTAGMTAPSPIAILLIDTGNEWGGGTNSMLELLKRADPARLRFRVCLYTDSRKGGGGERLTEALGRLGIEAIVLPPLRQPLWAKLGKEMLRLALL